MKKNNYSKNFWILKACLLQVITIPVLIAAGCEHHEREDLKSGILWVQYNSPDLKRIYDIGIDKNIDLDTGRHYNDYSREWIGMVEWPSDTTVTFFSEADNGMRLYIDGDTVIDGWGLQGQRKGVWQAKKGDTVPIRVEYFQDGGIAFMRLYWSWAGRKRELIPNGSFFYTSSQLNRVNNIAKEIEAELSPELREDHSGIYQAAGSDSLTWRYARESIPVYPGPHVLVSDHLFAGVKNIERRVRQPERDRIIPNPLINSRSDRCFQPFFSVLREPDKGLFRIWYGAWREDTSHSRSQLAYMTSANGIHFDRPMTICNTPEIQFGSEVIDRGDGWTDPARRYLYIYWLKGGSRLLVSPDGLNWKSFSDTTIISHNHDITGLWWDPLRQHYVATLSTMMRSDRWIGRRRTTMQSYSRDLTYWTDPAYVLYANPEQGDEGETQFYAMSAYLVRGPLIIGMVKVLRDDIISEGVAGDAYGRSYTSLAWSYDGRHWMRDLSPFFEPADDPQAWDHAHAWIDEQLIIGDSTWLYYGGYKQGHKKNRFSERQIGLVRMPRDRYVAWENETGMVGLIETVPLTMNLIPKALELNADAGSGEIRVAIHEAKTGNIIEGLGFNDCNAVKENDLQVRVIWGNTGLTRRLFRSLEGKTVYLSFKLQNARLFAFEFK